MTLTFNQFNKISGNKTLLPTIELTIEDKEIIAIQSETEYMRTFFELLEDQSMYTSKRVHMDKQALTGPDQVFIYRHEMGLYKRLNPEQMLNFWSKLHQSKIDSDRLLDISELSYARSTVNKRLTFSEMRRLHFARSLIQKTSVHVFEDPTDKIDLQSKQVFNLILEEIIESGGIVIILTSSLEEGIRMGTSVYRITDRGIQEVETDDEDAGNDEPKDENTKETTHQIKFEKISAKYEDKYILFDPLEIDYVETRERHTILHVNEEEFISTMSLKELEDKLLPYGFYRCHRSYLINLQRVREVIVWSKNSYSLILDNHSKKTVPLSKSKYAGLRDLLNW
ncbi:LytTR family transcriptional regulator DNA-binding domain-containing protein [Salicibibacter cibarius]|uniref:LytTR family transcriptional regulator DNA-binding domain-containing protein n=1 Tax=Salicibibacter cibarius TaxID=2743000 RepID=A0A7T6Z0S2_9BACI|nr:response regulator transcription factor [Salicibibacter cibarius]QQK74880.1 LytTR family transcriptional regulator DNA-binding domain-containing protein [Salicibibacter cibarius]